MNLDKKRFLDRLKGRVIEGKLYAFSEQGSEGTHWCLETDNKNAATHYDTLYIIEHGDRLVVFNEDDTLRWEGVIDLVYTTNCWQTIKGYGTVHGIQAGMEPEVWAKMFFDAMPAYLVKGKK
jgi:hypothetical protein